MNNKSVSELILAKGHRRNLLTGAITRICFVLITWLLIAIPQKISWVIKGQYSTHIIFSIVLIWSILAFFAYYFRRFEALVTLISTLIFDMLGITFLVAFTGGATSPFIILYLLEIVAVFYLGNFWQGFIVSITGGLFFLAMTLMTNFGIVHMAAPFTQVIRYDENPVQIFTTFLFIMVLIGYTIILNALMSRQIENIGNEPVSLRIVLHLIK